jgi:hypothetical protein
MVLFSFFRIFRGYGFFEEEAVRKIGYDFYTGLIFARKNLYLFFFFLVLFF